MNVSKAQREIFNQILSNNTRSTRWFRIDEHNIFVTPNGYIGYIFPVSTLAFNIDKLEEMKPITIKEVVKPENEIILTDDIRQRPNGQIRRLKKGKYSVFVNTKALEYFQNPKFFQDENDRVSKIIVTEFDRLLGNIPVGLIMPVRSTEHKIGYYRDGGWEESEDAK